MKVYNEDKFTAAIEDFHVTRVRRRVLLVISALLVEKETDFLFIEPEVLMAHVCLYNVPVDFAQQNDYKTSRQYRYENFGIGKLLSPVDTQGRLFLFEEDFPLEFTIKRGEYVDTFINGGSVGDEFGPGTILENKIYLLSDD